MNKHTLKLLGLIALGGISFVTHGAADMSPRERYADMLRRDKNLHNPTGGVDMAVEFKNDTINPIELMYSDTDNNVQIKPVNPEEYVSLGNAQQLLLTVGVLIKPTLFTEPNLLTRFLYGKAQDEFQSLAIPEIKKVDGYEAVAILKRLGLAQFHIDTVYTQIPQTSQAAVYLTAAQRQLPAGTVRRLDNATFKIKNNSAWPVEFAYSSGSGHTGQELAAGQEIQLNDKPNFFSIRARSLLGSSELSQKLYTRKVFNLDTLRVNPEFEGRLFNPEEPTPENQQWAYDIIIETDTDLTNLGGWKAYMKESLK